MIMNSCINLLKGIRNDKVLTRIENINFLYFPLVRQKSNVGVVSITVKIENLPFVNTNNLYRLETSLFSQKVLDQN